MSMKRFGQFTLAVAIAGLAVGASAQERKLIPPIRGEAALEITKPNTKLSGTEVVGDTYRHPRPLRAGEVVTITLRSPRNQAMDTNTYQFSHANGTIKVSTVPKIEVPPATAPK
jgi:hypothetical protein